MTSEQKIAANRNNALQSSGPQTLEGKMRSSRNSYRHGLAAKTSATADERRRSDALSRQLAGGSNDYWVGEAARRAADNFLYLERVKAKKAEVIEDLLRITSTVDFHRGTRELAKFETYERKARSRWKRSQRDLEARKAAAIEVV